jgi:chromate reductase
MQILGISGSLRSGSYNSELLRLAARLAPPGAELEVWEGLREIPPFDAELEDEPGAAVSALKELVAGVDAVLFATPEYNSSIPGQLKNALDWASRPYESNPFRNVPVAVIGASTGRFGAAWSQAELRKVLGAMGARVVETGLALGQVHERLREPDGELREAVRRSVEALVETSTRLPVRAAA